MIVFSVTGDSFCFNEQFHHGTVLVLYFTFNFNFIMEWCLHFFFGDSHQDINYRISSIFYFAVIK